MEDLQQVLHIDFCHCDMHPICERNTQIISWWGSVGDLRPRGVGFPKGLLSSLCLAFSLPALCIPNVVPHLYLQVVLVSGKPFPRLYPLSLLLGFSVFSGDLWGCFASLGPRCPLTYLAFSSLVLSKSVRRHTLPCRVMSATTALQLPLFFPFFVFLNSACPLCLGAAWLFFFFLIFWLCSM